MFVRKILCTPHFLCRNSRCSLSCATFTSGFSASRSVICPIGKLNLKERPLLYNELSGASLITNQKCYASASGGEIPIATYEEVKDLPKHPEKLLIDVREPEELQETGQIPTSINIPLPAIKRAFTLPEKYFYMRYKFNKPEKYQEIIFSCKSGKRAQMAVEIVTPLGYKNVKNYKGSWLDWAEREGLPK